MEYYQQLWLLEGLVVPIVSLLDRSLLSDFSISLVPVLLQLSDCLRSVLASLNIIVYQP